RPGGQLPAVRHRPGPFSPGARSGGSVTELARAAGPLAVAGLAFLILGRRRNLRLAGLGVWALGCGVLAYSVAPHGHRPLLAAAGVAGLILAAAGAALLLRWPWLLVLAALACVPARIPVKVGSTDANLLRPLFRVSAATRARPR